MKLRDGHDKHSGFTILTNAVSQCLVQAWQLRWISVKEWRISYFTIGAAVLIYTGLVNNVVYLDGHWIRVHANQLCSHIYTQPDIQPECRPAIDLHGFLGIKRTCIGYVGICLLTPA